MPGLAGLDGPVERLSDVEEPRPALLNTEAGDKEPFLKFDEIPPGAGVAAASFPAFGVFLRPKRDGMRVQMPLYTKSAQVGRRFEGSLSWVYASQVFRIDWGAPLGTRARARWLESVGTTRVEMKLCMDIVIRLRFS